ncbi:MAG: hypothetical protein IV100_00300 [Myxococcales bacterium]|nr:hypothetical protein [Myxococcales bacterium]
MIATSLMIVVFALPASGPQVVDLGVITFEAPGRLIPRSFVIVNPPALPEVDSASWPEAPRGALAAWRSAMHALTSPPAPGGDEASWQRERAALGKLERERAAALLAALKATPEASRDAPQWLVLGQLRWHAASDRWSTAQAHWDDCVAAGGDACTEPVLDVEPALGAWARVGAESPTLRAWALAYSGRLLQETGRTDAAASSFREVLAAPMCAPALRAWAGLQLGELLAERGDAEAREILERAASTGPDTSGSAARFRLLSMALSDGRWGDAARIGLAWHETPGAVEGLGADVSALTTEALLRLESSAPRVMVSAGRAGDALLASLLELAERHAVAGRRSWAEAHLSALAAAEGTYGKLDGPRRERIRGLLEAVPKDDVGQWGRRIIDWCADVLAHDAAPFTLVVTGRVETTRVGTRVTVVVSDETGEPGLVGRCFRGVVPPPEAGARGHFRVLVRYRS